MDARALSAVALAAAACACAGPERIVGEPGWKLVWHDEFSGEGPVDERDWVHEQGFVRNQELQWYAPENARREEGLLVLEARRERRANPSFEPGAKDWRRAREFAEFTSGSIKTRGLHEWLYGRFELRARIDTRAGLWPAFWTVGTARPWPGCGELDIMEYFRGTLLANAAWASPKPGAAVWDDSRTPLATLARDDGDADVAAWSSRFHVWRMDWDAERIRFFVDGRLLNEVDVARARNESLDRALPFREPQHVILNLAIGGTSGGDPSSTEFPARFEVDWVRVWQRE
ncbi:MAG: glycoside hydrolase family 16 protein [Planctomycetes bacterium]|nr:glycoside hydrolase family 16 protein [Planctomycetota bacterium]